MSAENKQYPPGTILADMLIDIYASKKRDDVWIMYSKAFENKLTRLIFQPENKELEFEFEDETRKKLGAPLRDALLPHFQKVQEVTFYLMDMETKKPIEAMKVPIETENK